MQILALLVSLVLFAIAALHAYWAFGGKWPGSTERELVDMVLGVGDKMPSPALCLVVTIGLALMGVMPLIASGLVDDGPLARLGLATALPWILAGIAAIFLLRGLASVAARFVPKMAKNHAARFVELDARYYGPLCLVIGGAYLWFYLALS